MALIEARAGGPPGQAGSAITPCPDQRGFLVIQVRDQRANGQPVLANTAVTVTVYGYPGQELTTNDAGLVTLAFDKAPDFENSEVSVVLRVPERLWEGKASTAGVNAVETNVANQTLTQLSVPVGGTFTLRVKVTTRKPGAAGDSRWVRGWSTKVPQLRRVTTPAGAAAQAAVDTDLVGSADVVPVVELTLRDLHCGSSHDLGIQRLKGIVDAASEVRLSIDGGDRLTAAAADANQNDVRYSRQAGNLLRLAVERHGAVIDVEYYVQFKQFLIVGEGTSYEYAVNLSRKYEDASDDREFKWIVVTQYDVVEPNRVSTRMSVLNWSNGAQIRNHNQRHSVQTALLRNMLRRPERFDATSEADWRDVLATYGEFDACIFNNPHIGYGVHMCVVMGLTKWRADDEKSQWLARKNGMAVSVYSLGVDRALSRVQLNGLLGAADSPDFKETVKSWQRQRNFVRTNALGCMNYTNSTATVIAGQYKPNNCSAMTITVGSAFVYANGAGIRNYGEANEFKYSDVQNHYASMTDTLGLQKYLLRCYRHWGLTVLKVGGWLYINGSVQMEDELGNGFKFIGTAVAPMDGSRSWQGSTTFVHYNTNFTSPKHHPSWYSQWDFSPYEPNIRNAINYGVQKA